jgi:activator of 2-hydroxyglutaryl-CoA dehydratase
MVKALSDKLGVPLNVSEDCHYMGALGAALFALDRIETSRRPAHRAPAEVQP